METPTPTLHLTDQLRTRLERGASVEQELPGGGYLMIDRPLPFLFVYRQPRRRPDRVTERLVTTQAAYLVAPGATDHHADLTALLHTIAEVQAAATGGFLLVELWATPEAGEGERSHPLSLQPAFCLHTPHPAPTAALETLTDALAEVHVHHQAAEVTTRAVAAPAPPEMPPLDLPEGLPDGCFRLGLEVLPVYRQAGTGAVFPFLFAALRRQLALALKRTGFRFARTCTRLTPPHFLALGRSRLEATVGEVDRALSEIDTSFAFLLQTTPVNADDAWARFEASNYREEPVFQYRPLPVDPELLKRRLFDLPIEHIEDPALAWLFREKQEELDRKITMLRDRDTRNFFFGSLQLFGEVQPALLRLARQILARLPAHDHDLGSPEHLDAEAFAEVAGAEFTHYRRQYPAFPETVEIRTDLPPGLMVSRGRLLIGHRTKVPASRVEALLHHEVGTHMVTYYNGCAQPLRLLRNGLAGYEALQEGLAVLAEYLAGGLNIPRLRVLAARVVAAHALIEGTSFVDVYQLLREAYAFPSHEAFSITLRTFRGGGLIKDVIYLRGLHELMEHLRDGGAYEPLFVGKIALHHLPILEELQHREILHPSPLHPRYLELNQAPDRLERVRNGLTFVDLVERQYL